MIAAHVQRWREKRSTYRPAGEPINTTAFDVAELRDDATPKAFVEQHHYSGTYPAARWRFGLFRRCELVGVAVFSHPTNDKALTSVFPGHARDSVELGRFVLVDDVPANGETWFLARAFALLRREGLRGVVSFSDPIPRTTSTGELVAPGHVGTIYQAFNAAYLGRATPRTLHLLNDGTVFSARTQQKIRRRERGWRYAVELGGERERVATRGGPLAASRRCAWPRWHAAHRARGRAARRRRGVANVNADPRTWPPEGRELLARILREAQRVAAERKRFDPRTTQVYGASR